MTTSGVCPSQSAAGAPRAAWFSTQWGAARCLHPPGTVSTGRRALLRRSLPVSAGARWWEHAVRHALAALPRLLPRDACHQLSEEDVDPRCHSSSPRAVSHRAPALKSRPPGRQASGPRGGHRAPPVPRRRAGLAAPPASAPGSALSVREPRGESLLAALAGAAAHSLSCAGGRHTARPAKGWGGSGSIKGTLLQLLAHGEWAGAAGRGGAELRCPL